MAVIFVFIDGVGLGEPGSHNPVSENGYRSLGLMSGGQPFDKRADRVEEDGHLFKPIDARLGMDGLPQSGTGQTALFTGVNAPKVVGRHFGPFPHSALKPYLREESIFKKVQARGYSCIFMNAYPQVFFDHAQKRNRWSCTTLMTRSAGIPLNTIEDVQAGTAHTAELTQRAWRDKLDLDVPQIEAEEAADRVLDQANKHDLLLSEYYLTDKAGHAQKEDYAHGVLNPLDQFLYRLINQKKAEDTLLVTSDHGNLEDLSTKTHTLNPVPLFVKGPGATAFRAVESLMDVPGAILEALD